MGSPLSLASRQARLQFADDVTLDSPFTSGFRRAAADDGVVEMPQAEDSWDSLLRKLPREAECLSSQTGDIHTSAVTVPPAITIPAISSLDFSISPNTHEYRRQFARATVREILHMVERRESWPRIEGLLPNIRRPLSSSRRASTAYHYYPTGEIPTKAQDIISSVWSRVPHNHFHELLEWSAFCMPSGFLDRSVCEGYVRTGTWSTDMKSHAHLVLHRSNAVYLRILAFACPEVTDIWDLLKLALVCDIPFTIGFLLGDYPSFSYAQSSLSFDDRVLVKTFLDPFFVNPLLTYRLSGTSMTTEYLARVRDLMKRPHMRALIGMGGTCGILGRIYGGEELIHRFMEGPSILVRQHMLGETDTDAVDSVGLIWDRVSPGEVDIMHGFMVHPGEQDRSLYPMEDVLRGGMPSMWCGFVYDIFKKVAEEIEQGTAVSRSKSEWHDYFHQNYGELFKRVGKDASTGIYLPSDTDYQYGHALARDAFPISWDKRRINELSIPVALVEALA